LSCSERCEAVAPRNDDFWVDNTLFEYNRWFYHLFNKEAASGGEARGLDNQDKWKMYWDHKLAGRVFPM
jgi:hypothetical protein